MESKDRELINSKKLSELRVVDLKEELEKRGLDKSGIKAVLIERLVSALMEEPEKEDEGYKKNEIVVPKEPVETAIKPLIEIKKEVEDPPEETIPMTEDEEFIEGANFDQEMEETAEEPVNLPTLIDNPMDLPMASPSILADVSQHFIGDPDGDEAEDDNLVEEVLDELEKDHHEECASVFEIFCSGFGEEVKAPVLKDLFAVYGKVKKVRIIIHNPLDESKKRYGVIRLNVPTDTASKAVTELNGLMLNGHRLQVGSEELIKDSINVDKDKAAKEKKSESSGTSVPISEDKKSSEPPTTTTTSSSTPSSSNPPPNGTNKTIDEKKSSEKGKSKESESRKKRGTGDRGRSKEKKSRDERKRSRSKSSSFRHSHGRPRHPGFYQDRHLAPATRYFPNQNRFTYSPVRVARDREEERRRIAYEKERERRQLTREVERRKEDEIFALKRALEHEKEARRMAESEKRLKARQAEEARLIAEKEMREKIRIQRELFKKMEEEEMKKELKRKRAEEKEREREREQREREAREAREREQREQREREILREREIIREREMRERALHLERERVEKLRKEEERKKRKMEEKRKQEEKDKKRSYERSSRNKSPPEKKNKKERYFLEPPALPPPFVPERISFTDTSDLWMRRTSTFNNSQTQSLGQPINHLQQMSGSQPGSSLSNSASQHILNTSNPPKEVWGSRRKNEGWLSASSTSQRQQSLADPWPSSSRGSQLSVNPPMPSNQQAQFPYGGGLFGNTDNSNRYGGDFMNQRRF